MNKKQLIVAFLIFLTSSSSIASDFKEADSTREIVADTKAPAIGDSLGGGMVFKVVGSTVYIVATSDQSSATWGCEDTIILGAQKDTIGTGKQNTIEIVTGCNTAGIAARVCSDLTLEGYSDWYLPSKDELSAMYALKVAGFGSWSVHYWSSTDAIGGYAWSENFNNGHQFPSLRTNEITVRCVRSY